MRTDQERGDLGDLVRFDQSLERLGREDDLAQDPALVQPVSRRLGCDLLLDVTVTPEARESPLLRYLALLLALAAVAALYFSLR